MFSKDQIQIYETCVPYKKLRFSFLQEFNIDGKIDAENIKNIKWLDPNVDGALKYKFLFLSKEPIKVSLDSSISNLKRTDADLPVLEYFAFPVCGFFGNHFLWIYLTEEEWLSNSILKPTDENFVILEPGKKIYVKARHRTIKDDLGADYKFSFDINLGLLTGIYETEENLLDIRYAKSIINGPIPDDLKFVVIESGKKFFNDYLRIDSVDNTGTWIQPIRILTIGKHPKTGWIAVTPMRLRYWYNESRF
jgi:hypothetical protein